MEKHRFMERVRRGGANRSNENGRQRERKNQQTMKVGPKDGGGREG